jgi:hypothetical protein
MLPALRPGQFCVFRKAWRYKDGDVVFAYANGRPVVKRAHRYDTAWHLEGDNHLASNRYQITRQTRTNRLVAKLWFPRAGAKETV